MRAWREREERNKDRYAHSQRDITEETETKTYPDMFRNRATD